MSFGGGIHFKGAFQFPHMRRMVNLFLNPPRTHHTHTTSPMSSPSPSRLLSAISLQLSRTITSYRIVLFLSSEILPYRPFVFDQARDKRRLAHKDKQIYPPLQNKRKSDGVGNVVVEK